MAMANQPVPAVVDVQPLEQLFAGVEEQALAEAPRARQEEMLALVEQPADIGRLIDVVAIVFADLAEGLNADG